MLLINESDKIVAQYLHLVGIGEQRFQIIGKRLGYAFSYAEDEAGGKIVNLLSQAHMFSSKPAVAFDFKKPRKVLITRSLVYLAQLGLSFVPLPGLIKSAANAVADSFYVDQGKTEGTLVGFLEDRGENKLAHIIMRQSVYV